ncbi:GntR family transcriptional regulator [Roseimaritima ulvae]|uniref:HTH-type transcriptional repressor YtrA n=1 Tax=Roseimaritima ulvae TaxID=980254 RepID=A0A5B9QTH8_9BACT|nr:GntR family transcriptional regulator [Roseimaritima ulvae]QEG42318.1 HTH-type transcriptional repressor YtrA [Roseimaritima ulvae]
MFRIKVAAGSGLPIYRQIADQIRQAVVSGSLSVGDGLPSVRALAKELVVNPNTVAKAYAELTRDGILESQPGRGVSVGTPRQVFSKAERDRRLEAALNTFLSETLAIGCSERQIREAVDKRLQKLTPETSKG